jgi:hypothetical protein
MSHLMITICLCPIDSPSFLLVPTSFWTILQPRAMLLGSLQTPRTSETAHLSFCRVLPATKKRRGGARRRPVPQKGSSHPEFALVARIPTRTKVQVIGQGFLAILGTRVKRAETGHSSIALGILTARRWFPNALPRVGFLGAMAVAESAIWLSLKKAPEFPAAPNTHDAPVAFWRHQEQVLVRYNV